MKKIVYFSNYNEIRTKEFYGNLLEAVESNREEELYYILPNGKIINEYREKILEDLGGNFPLNLYTFDDIVTSLLDENKELIGDEFKFLIISSILDEMDRDKSLNYYSKFRDMDGFVHSLIDIIVNFKRNLIRSKAVKENLNLPKYRELGLIYERYENFLLKNDLLDREEAYFLVLQKIKEQKIELPIKTIYIDEFYDFRPIEMEMIAIFSKLEIDIFININSKMLRENKILKQSLDKLSSLGFKVVEEAYENNGFAKLGYGLFSNMEKTDLVLKSLVASSKYLEVKKVFEEIKKDIVSGVDLNKIGIISLDDSYNKIIEEVLRIEKLPFDANFEKNALDIKLSREIINILKLPSSENLGEALINRIHSRYFIDLDNEEKNTLIRILKNARLGDISDFESFLNRKSYYMDMEELTLLNVLREIYSEIRDLETKSTILDCNDYLRDIFEKYNLKQEILSSLDRDLDLFSQESESYEIIEAIIEDLKKLSEYKNEMNLSMYTDLWLEFLKAKTITSYKRKHRGIKLLKLIDNRGFLFENLYILGMSREFYPNIKEDNFLFQDRNLDIIEKLKMEYKTYDLKLDNEILKIYRSLASVKNKLTISYTKGESNEVASSLFFEELKSKALKNIEEIIDFEFLFKKDIDNVTNNKEYLKYILLNIDKDLSDLSFEMEENFIEDMNRKLKTIRARSEEEGNYNGTLATKVAKDIIYTKYKDYRYSATSLETYARCPYRFFMNYVLKLEEIYEEDGEDFLGLGNLYHSVLYDFYSKHYSEEIAQSDIEKIVDDLFDYHIGRLELKNKSRLDKLYLANKKQKMMDFIIMDIARLRKNQIKPVKFESVFGKDQDFYIKDTKIYGKIDRIDNLGDGRAIIDYKSSNSISFNDMEKGISLQMPIYFMSQKDKMPLAAMYGLIEKSKYEVGFGLKDSVDEIKRKKLGKFDNNEELDEFLEETATKIDGIREKIIAGDFRVEPIVCDKYCDFKNICRYSKVGE